MTGLMNEVNYSLKYGMTAEVEQAEDGSWGWVIRRGKTPVAKSVIQSGTRTQARVSLERILFAIRHNGKPVKILDE